MLKSLHIKNFTVFSTVNLTFGKNLNVIVGENGAGKTHILKAAYSAIAVSAAGKGKLTTKAQWQLALANKLLGVFRPDSLGRLVRRRVGRSKCELNYVFNKSAQNLSLIFSTVAKTEVKIKKAPSEFIDKQPVFLPTRELLTIFPGFVSLYENTHLPFEETWRDTCILLGAPLAKGPRLALIGKLLKPLEDSMGGRVEWDKSGRFYLNLTTGSMEMHLVAEGLRKLATIARLIATGSLLDSGYLFWDEPESNLNPKILKGIAKTILQVAQNGVQVFIATHSLFLLRELHILQQSSDFSQIDAKYFGLHIDQGGIVTVSQGSTIDEIGSIDSLDEDLQQSDRYMDTEMKLSN